MATGVLLATLPGCLPQAHVRSLSGNESAEKEIAAPFAEIGESAQNPGPLPDFGPADTPEPGSDILAGLWQEEPVPDTDSPDAERSAASATARCRVIEFSKFGSFREWEGDDSFGKTGSWKLEGNRLRLTVSPASESGDMYAQAYQEDTGEPFVPPTIEYEGKIKHSGMNALTITWENGRVSVLSPYPGVPPNR